MTEPKHAAVTALDINWTVRLKNKAWWLAIIPAAAILVQAFLAIFDITWDYSTLIGKIAAIIDAVFVVLALLGIVVDPTVDGFADSARALNYTEPAANINEITLVKDDEDDTHFVISKDDAKTGGTD